MIGFTRLVHDHGDEPEIDVRNYADQQFLSI